MAALRLEVAMGLMQRYCKYLKMQSLLISRRQGAGLSSVGPGPVERSRGFERGLRDRQFAYPLGTVPPVIPGTINEDATLIGKLLAVILC